MHAHAYTDFQLFESRQLRVRTFIRVEFCDRC